MIRTFHYVPLPDVIAWLRCGWIIVKPNCTTHHDSWSITMEWLCDCKMVKPK